MDAFARDQADAMQTIVLCHGEKAAVIEFGEPFGPDVQVVADRSGANRRRWGVDLTPFAIAVDEENRIVGRVAHIERADLEDLAGRVGARAVA